MGNIVIDRIFVWVYCVLAENGELVGETFVAVIRIAASRITTRIPKAVQLIPERYRIPVEVDVAFHFHAESVTKMNEDVITIRKKK